METTSKIVISIAFSTLTAFALVFMYNNFVIGMNRVVGYVFVGMVATLLILHLVFISRLRKARVRIVLVVICLAALVWPFVYIKWCSKVPYDVPGHRYLDVR
jgi:hypothetical protein